MARRLHARQRKRGSQPKVAGQIVDLSQHDHHLGQTIMLCFCVRPSIYTTRKRARIRPISVLGGVKTFALLTSSNSVRSVVYLSQLNARLAGYLAAYIDGTCALGRQDGARDDTARRRTKGVAVSVQAYSGTNMIAYSKKPPHSAVHREIQLLEEPSPRSHTERLGQKLYTVLHNM